ncbi:MAG: homoserine dehydrogenase [Bryobacteraceae bacterium]|nr:homoserine dehydrogenase [Bryobacteraceae bacterium]MDW8378522.1 homoserine dehydrogenase [Bryobacterales bacterium]
MDQVNIGVIGLGNVGLGTLTILAENAAEITQKLGFSLHVEAVCSPSVARKALPAGLASTFRTPDWREVVANPRIQIIAELVGGTTVAREIIESAIAAGKSVVTANKELMALEGCNLWDQAIKRGINLAMEASVAGGIPIHAVLREGISGDRVVALQGILNGTSNYILTEIERHGADFDAVLKDAQRLGYAEADPSADIDGWDARSKLAILAALAFGERITPGDIHTEGIRRISPIDFQYAHQLGHTIKLLCSARRSEQGLFLSVRPTLIPRSTILASVQGAYNAIWVRGAYGQDTFYYGRGAGPHPTGVAVVSDLMRVAREIRAGSPERVSPFAHSRLGDQRPLPVTLQKSGYYLRFRVNDRPGIIAALAGILAEKRISLDAVLQLPSESKQGLPFVITLEPAYEADVREALAQMAGLDFMVEPPLALPMERPV